jgi:glutamate decarboxylase
MLIRQRDTRTLSPEEATLVPVYGRRALTAPVPRYELPEDAMDPAAAYNLVHDELMLDGNARLNLASFVTTWMEPEAERLMTETLSKNLIDRDEYPVTARIEERCVNMLARLFHAPDPEGEGGACGVSTIGSSEAIMLAGLALKWRWREQVRAAGRSPSAPNLVMGSNVQVVWDKFCRYWDVEPRLLPVRPDRFTITPEQVVAAVDDDTIGVVTILGVTYTGQYDPIGEIHDALAAHNAVTGREVPMHVDAATGGFVAPFLQPELAWDFRLPLVSSINVSGHKYGLVYPGVGWAIWRDRRHLPAELVFHVGYLGGDMPTFTLNFSRPASQVVAQYYNFLRLGKAGYRRIMEALRDTASYIASALRAMPEFSLVSDGTETPVIAFSTTPAARFTAFELSDKLREHGWQVPAYAMPPDAEDVTVLRIVVREGLSRDLASMLMDDLGRAVRSLSSAPREAARTATSHTGRPRRV